MNPEYQNACFRATPPLNGWPRSFGIITACNPDGQIVSDQENAQATERLRRELVAAKLEHFPVTGGSKDFTHAEPGFGVVFPNQEEAIAWGQRYQQEAIFWILDNNCSLVYCNLPIGIIGTDKLLKFFLLSVEIGITWGRTSF